jgi:glycosyltransferase involved in cell wall biosynthesis
MNAPKASIIVTNYNYGRFIGRCIDSALAQDYPKVEVVVVDDASQDDSRDIIQSYGSKIVPVLQKRNGGQGAAFNAGFCACTGDVVLFLDADDWLHPNAVARVVERMTAGVAQVQFRLHLVDGHGRKIGLLPAPEVAFDDGDVVPLLLSRGRYECTVTSGNAFSRATLAAILPVPEERFRISADGYLVTVAPFSGKVASIEEPLGAYAVHGANNWSASAIGNAAAAAKFRREIYHDRDRYGALREEAAKRDLAVADDPGIADPQHLIRRIGSLILEPARHSDPGDWRVGLALRGVQSSRRANLPGGMRVLQAMWFLALGVLPRPWAAKALLWRIDSDARPERLRRMMAALRRRAQPSRAS